MSQSTDRASEVWKRIRSRTVWDPSYTLEDSPPRYWPLYTVVLPLTYFSFMVFGTLGTIATVPAIDRFASVGYGDIWGMVIGFLSTITLFGLIFRLHWLELIATVLLVVALASYPISVAGIAIFDHDLNRWALAAGLPVLLYLSAWRVTDLVRFIRKAR